MCTNDEFSPNTNATGKRSITPIAIHHSDTGVIQLEETVVGSGFLLCHKYNDHVDTMTMSTPFMALKTLVFASPSICRNYNIEILNVDVVPHKSLLDDARI